MTATALATSITSITQHTVTDSELNSRWTRQRRHTATTLQQSVHPSLDTSKFNSSIHSCPLLYCQPVPYRACRCAPSQQL
jgi:hypothetical protein